MIARVEIAKGSDEPIIVDLSDRLGNLTNLDDASPTFEITSPDSEGTSIVSGDAIPITDTLSATIPVDTTSDDLPAGEYWIFLTFTADTFTPRLGPIVLVIT